MRCVAVCLQFIQSYKDKGTAATSRTVRLLMDALNDTFGIPTTAARAQMLVQVCRVWPGLKGGRWGVACARDLTNGVNTVSAAVLDALVS